MKRVVIFVGSARRQLTYYAASRFSDNLQALGDVECDIVTLSNYQLGTCRGCKLCFDKGEEYCPLKDDRDELIGKIMAADGVVIATPNYSFQVSAITKIFLDRLGFVFHRPRFFGKTFTGIVAQGLLGGRRIVNYLNFFGKALICNTVKGCCVTACQPMTKQEKQKIDRTLADLSKRFYARLTMPAYPAPSLLNLWGFRAGRTSIRMMLGETSPDYDYYKQRGWFQSDYYYPARLGLAKTVAGSLFDSMAARSVRKKGY